MILEDNTFVDVVLPSSVLRDLTDEEMYEYRRPYKNRGEDRRPTLTWPRQLPIEGEHAHPLDSTSGRRFVSDRLMAQSQVDRRITNPKRKARICQPN